MPRNLTTCCATKWSDLFQQNSHLNIIDADSAIPKPPNTIRDTKTSFDCDCTNWEDAVDHVGVLDALLMAVYQCHVYIVKFAKKNSGFQVITYKVFQLAQLKAMAWAGSFGFQLLGAGPKPLLGRHQWPGLAWLKQARCWDRQSMPWSEAGYQLILMRDLLLAQLHTAIVQEKIIYLSLLSPPTRV